MDINSNVAPILKADLLTVGVSKVALPVFTLKITRGIQLKADSANTGVIYFGGTDVTTSGKSFPLKANETILLQIDQLELINFISDTASQKLWYFVL